MYFCVFLVSALLFSSSESSAAGPAQTVRAFAGGDVILPCSFNTTASDDLPTVEWSKEGLRPNVVMLYRDGCETPEMKNPAFRYRTSFITEELKNRNISLRISNVQLSDAGTYQCMTLWKSSARDVTTVELVVGAVSEPRLSVTAADSGGVTLQCDATCWLPEPEIQFLNHEGNKVPAAEPKRSKDASGCFTVTRRVTVQDAPSRVTCRVQQPQLNQTRDTEILLPVYCTFPRCLTIGGVVSLLVLLPLASCGLVVLLWKRCGKCGSSQAKCPPVVEADNMETSIEQLTRKVAGLESKLREKEEIIRQLQNNNTPTLSPVVCQLDQPTMVCSPAASDSHRPQPGNVPHSQGPRPGNVPHSHHPQPGNVPHSQGPQPGNVPHSQGPQPGNVPHSQGPRPGNSPHSQGPRPGNLPHSQGPQPGNVPHTQGPRPGNLPHSQGPQPGNVPHSQGPQPGNLPHSQGPRPGNLPHSQGPQPGNLPHSQGPRPGNVPHSQGPLGISRESSTQAPGAQVPRKRVNSSPAALCSSSSVNTSKKKLSRSMSEASAWSRPKGPKLVSPQSIMSHNRFRPLAGLTEESELLMSPDTKH